MKPVRIPNPEYQAIKALAKKRGQFLSFVLAEAVRQYLEGIKQKEQAA